MTYNFLHLKLKDRTYNKPQQEEVAKQTKHDIIKLRINLFDIQDPLYLDAVSVDELDDFLDVCIHGSPYANTERRRTFNKGVEE